MTTANRTWRLHALTGPDGLRLDDLPMPEPGAGEVRLRILAGGLNRSDLMRLTGLLFVPELPSKVGREICGVVDKLGPGVEQFQVGQRLSSMPFFFGGDHQNFADFAVLPAKYLASTPDNLSNAQGASFAATYLTSYCGLVETGEIKPWQDVLITAATSANGIAAIAVARKAGATVIATTRKADRKRMLIEAGAHHAIATESESLAQRVAEITGGRGCELVYDGAGGQLANEIIECIAPDGHWVQFGLLDPTPVLINFVDWFRTKTPRLTLYSLSQYSGVEALGHPGRPEGLARAVRATLRGVEEGSLPVRVSQEFEGIRAVPDAFRAMAADTGGGKIVVNFSA